MSTMKKIEDAVVGRYRKVEDKFIDTFLKQDEESTEDVKKRIATEQEKMKEKQEKLVKKSTVTPNVACVKTTAEIQAEIEEKYGK